MDVLPNTERRSMYAFELALQTLCERDRSYHPYSRTDFQHRESMVYLPSIRIARSVVIRYILAIASVSDGWHW